MRQPGAVRQPAHAGSSQPASAAQLVLKPWLLRQPVLLQRLAQLLWLPAVLLSVAAVLPRAPPVERNIRSMAAGVVRILDNAGGRACSAADGC
jgi:hypothetical protein